VAVLHEPVHVLDDRKLTANGAQTRDGCEHDQNQDRVLTLILQLCAVPDLDAAGTVHHHCDQSHVQERAHIPRDQPAREPMIGQLFG
jgi:hypothetical protein